MQSILITGANGFIGRNLCKKYHDCGYKVYGIGHGKIDYSEKLKFGIYEWKNSDVELNSLLEYDINFDIIIHCAGGSSVAKSISNPFLDFEKTVLSTISVLEFIRIKKLSSKLVYLSSSAVYGNSHNFSEETECNPISPYGMNKLISENLCKFYSNSYHIKCCIIRLFSVYGPELQKQLIWDAVSKFKNNKSPIFFGTGFEVRDWIYIDDAISLIYILAQLDFKFNIFNAGSGIGIQTIDVITLIKKELNIDNEFNFNSQLPDGDPAYLVANINKLNKINWIPHVSFENGISLVINNIKNNNT